MEVPLTAGPSTGSVDGSGGCCRSTARQLQLCKLLYFLEGFSFASFGRFATLYYLSRGLDAHEIGLIEACRPATAIVGGGVLFGWLSDRLRRKKAVFLAITQSHRQRYPKPPPIAEPLARPTRYTCAHQGVEYARAHLNGAQQVASRCCVQSFVSAVTHTMHRLRVCMLT